MLVTTSQWQHISDNILVTTLGPSDSTGLSLSDSSQQGLSACGVLRGPLGHGPLIGFGIIFHQNIHGNIFTLYMLQQSNLVAALSHIPDMSLLSDSSGVGLNNNTNLAHSELTGLGHSELNELGHRELTKLGLSDHTNLGHSELTELGHSELTKLGDSELTGLGLSNNT